MDALGRDVAFPAADRDLSTFRERRLAAFGQAIRS